MVYRGFLGMVIPHGSYYGTPCYHGITIPKQEAQLKQGLADRTAKTAVSAAI